MSCNNINKRKRGFEMENMYMNNQQIMNAQNSQQLVRRCYFHANEPAVAQCAKCGKSVCKDCADSYR